ncbi:MAG: alpha-mannosidase, partial [Eubacteriales bacterium]|nr:alpha-mannosidase [Eubacteriales bacterium]
LTQYVLSQTIRLNPSKNIFIPTKVYKAKIALDAKNVPALGYVQYSLDINNNSNQEIKELSYLENEFYKISINEKGSLDIYDKIADFNYKNQAVLVENGDDGDSFNYSPPRQDLEVFSTDSEFKYNIQGSSLYQSIKIEYNMLIPANLEDRANKNVSVNLPVTLEVNLRKGSKVIDFNVKVDNKGLSHRLCILFDSYLATKFNYADQQFGIIKRPNLYEKEMQLYLEGLGNTDKVDTTKVVELANWVNNQSTWQEPPISIEPTQSYVSLTDNKRGIALFPQGVREYEVIGNDGNQIRLTLFRTYGFMGKENLVYRPGRASGEKIIETKDAQLLKEMEFKLGFTTYTNNINDANIDTLAKKYNTPMQVYEYADFLNGRLIFSLEDVEKTLNNKLSLFQTTNNLVVSAIKKCEDKKGFIIRLYNGKDHKDIGEQIKFNFNISKAYFTNLKEENIKEINVKDNTINIEPISHCKFLTLY